MEFWNGEILGYYTGYKVYESSEPYQYQTVEAHSNSDNVELHLTNLRKFTKYSVLVQAFNRMGRGPHSDEVVALTSEDVPSEPPQDVQCVTHTSQSLHVSWSQPSSHSQNGVIRDDVEFHTTTTTALKTNLHSLDKYTNYSIRVLAYTRMGDGIRSDPVHCRTLEDVPGAPADIKSLTMSSDSILVAWRPPINKNGNIIKYTLYIRGTDNGKQHTTKHFLSSAPHLSHEARGLTENRNYDFWVTASTVIGEGESTRVVTQSPKSKVMARIATFSERIVSKWKQDIFLPCRAVGLPTPTKKWRMEDKIQKLERFTNTEDGSLLIKEVLSVDSSNYTCEVENIYGRDQITYQLVIQAPPTAPVLALLQSTESSIRLKINISNTTENKIKGFTLSYKKEYGEWEEIEIEPHEDTVLLENLYCGTKYHLYLTAYNKVGAGEPSSILIISTLGA
uniref:Down syndrome cell adhesion molecule-like protein Dscam2 n=1 Tax=Strigamia maritima TaxID=126957 RepID=T1J9F3_STRMM